MRIKYLRPIQERESAPANAYRCPNCDARCRIVPGEPRRIIVVHDEKCRMQRAKQTRFPILCRRIERDLEIAGVLE
jgi:hypothetical protein